LPHNNETPRRAGRLRTSRAVVALDAIIADSFGTRAPSGCCFLGTLPGARPRRAGRCPGTSRLVARSGPARPRTRVGRPTRRRTVPAGKVRVLAQPERQVE